jgi:exodeoxyribonuclease-5
LIYKWEEEYGKQVRKTIDERIQGAKLVICDESSMVTREEGTNLMAMCKKAGAKLLVIGDPGQLPPVDPEAEKRGERPDFFLLNPDGFLTQVMRQAAENPIIQLSMDIRTATDNGVAYMFPTHIEKIGRNVFLRTKTQIQLPTLAKVIQGGGAIIAGTNKTRRGFNHALRAFLGFNQPTLMEGEKVLIKENCEGGEVTNGMRGTVTNVHMMSDGLIYFDFTPDAFPGIHRLSVHPDILFERKTKKQMSWENIERKKKGLKPIELGVEVFFGYVITAHASQGGQWKNVYVIDEGWVFNRGGDPEGFAKQNRWTYTAVTRASENLVIYRGGKLDIPSEQFARELAARLNAQS